MRGLKFDGIQYDIVDYSFYFGSLLLRSAMLRDCVLIVVSVRGFRGMSLFPCCSASFRYRGGIMDGIKRRIRLKTAVF